MEQNNQQSNSPLSTGTSGSDFQSNKTAENPPITLLLVIIFQTNHLPKLALPLFNGSPLEWQSFWDSFPSAVHKNSSSLSSGSYTINTVHLFPYKRPTAQKKVKIFGKWNGAVRSFLVMVQSIAKEQ